MSGAVMLGVSVALAASLVRCSFVRSGMGGSSSAGGRRARCGSSAARRLIRVAAAAVAVVVVAAPAPARADLATSWTALLPAAPAGSDPSQAAECPGGEPQCVDQVADALSAHVAALGCSHNAVFALTYQRITERIGEAVRTAGFFREPTYIGHFDAAFAGEYGRQWDAWAASQPQSAAPAWRIAFAAAEARRVRGMGNLQLALNAHIARDMPIVLERVGLVGAAGASRKPDQDKVNEVLYNATRAIVAELAGRYDATIDDGDVPGSVDDKALYQWVAALRERAWRLAEQLDAADGDAAAKGAVLDRIEAEAQASALAIEKSTAYPPDSSEPAARDAYCAAHSTP
jgi:hypothetical protein